MTDGGFRLPLPRLPERPRVTFALFAYNQESYIREAVEAAFAQTYAPLDIILSDDGSDDRTFDIMREMAAAYTGPHRVRARRNERNLGIGSHVETVLAAAEGQIFVMAAGDDVSRPERVQEVVRHFQANRECPCVCALAEDYLTGAIMAIDPPRTVRELLSRERYILGATASYRREVIDCFPPFAEDIHHEDDVLALRALLLGGAVGLIPRPLVRYRRGVGVSGAYAGGRDDRRLRLKTGLEAGRRIRTCRQWRADLRHAGRLDEASHMARFENLNALSLSLTSSRVTAAGLVHFIGALGPKCVLYEIMRYRANRLLRAYLMLKAAFSS